MSRYIHKSHNVGLCRSPTVLLYHIVCPAKYRRVIFDAVVVPDGASGDTLRDTCLEIEKRYEIEFLEIGTDRDHVHFLVQSVPWRMHHPPYSPTKIVRTIKSLTARQVRALHPELRKALWGGQFWSEGYFIRLCLSRATVGRHASEEVIRRYVEGQGQGHEYEQLHKGDAGQFDLFDTDED